MKENMDRNELIFAGARNFISRNLRFFLTDLFFTVLFSVPYIS